MSEPLSHSVFSGWAVRGLGGAAAIVLRLVESGLEIDNAHLLELRAIVTGLIDAYNRLASASGLEPHERQPIPTATAAPAATIADAPPPQAAESASAAPAADRSTS